MKLLLALVLYVGSIHLLASDQTFIVKQEDKKLTKHSANTLKEMLGEMTRDLFKQTISLHKQLGLFHVALDQKKDTGSLHKILGSWQVEVAQLQNHCSDILEKLIDNQKPFKKATKQELQAAYTSMQESMTVMTGLVAKVQQHRAAIGEAALVTTSVQQYVEQTQQVQKTFNTHTCLRMT